MLAKAIDRAQENPTGVAGRASYRLGDIRSDHDGDVGIESSGSFTRTSSRTRASQITDGTVIIIDSSLADTLGIDQSLARSNTTVTAMHPLARKPSPRL